MRLSANLCQPQIRLTLPFANHPSRVTEKVEGEPSLRGGLLHGRIYLRTFARMREEGEEARKQVRGKSRQRGTGRDCYCCHRIKVASVKSKSHTALKVCVF